MSQEKVVEDDLIILCSELYCGDCPRASGGSPSAPDPDPGCNTSGTVGSEGRGQSKKVLYLPQAVICHSKRWEKGRQER